MSLERKKEGHRSRLRERFRESGLQAFQDHEVLELLLTLATPRKDCKPLAWSLLERFKSLSGVFGASMDELCEIRGIGENNAIPICLVKEAADRLLRQNIEKKEILGRPQAVMDYLYLYLKDKSKELFIVFYLDVKNRLIKTETLFEGSLSSSSVYPRELVRSVIVNKAAAVIFAHNHPSGDTRPSQEDYIVTRRLFYALAPINVSVHEHLIVGDGSYYSFAEKGVIRAIEREYHKLESDFKKEMGLY